MLTASEEIHTGTMVRTWLDHPDGPDAAPAGVRRRGKKALDRMVSANLRLVIALARKYSRRGQQVGLEMADLIAEGNLGLIRGCEKFDPAKGYKASTYLYWWVRQSLTRALEASGSIRLPAQASQRYCKVQRVMADLGPGATLADAAEVIGLRIEEVEELIALATRARRVASLDAATRGAGDGDGSNLLELIAAEGDQESSLVAVDMEQAVARLRGARPDDLAVVEELLIAGSASQMAKDRGCNRETVAFRVRAAKTRLRAAAGPEVLELVA